MYFVIFIVLQNFAAIDACSSFDDVIFDVCMHWLESAYYTPKIRVSGEDLTP